MINIASFVAAFQIINPSHPTPGYVYIPFVYNSGITNVMIECSTNILTWRDAIENYDYFWGEDGMGPYIEPTHIVPVEFFRVVGQPTK